MNPSHSIDPGLTSVIPDKLPVHDGIEFIKPGKPETIEEIKAAYWPLIRAKGYYIIVKPYVRPEKVGSILLAGVSRAEDPFQTQVGQVIDIGPLAYTNRDMTGGLTWCQIGDWVTFPRIAGAMIFKKAGSGNADESIPFRRIKDDDIDGVISNPEDWIMGIPKQF